MYLLVHFNSLNSIKNLIKLLGKNCDLLQKNNPVNFYKALNQIFSMHYHAMQKERNFS